MAIEHTLLDMDTLPSLALQYLGDATRWKEIADYNRLEYPYLIQDKEALKGYFGSGYITLVRANYQSGTTIKQGWQFKTKANAATGNIIKTFEVIEDTLIPAGSPIGYIPLRCTVPGSFGNVVPYMIVEVGDNTAKLSGISFLAIYNEQAFTGGKDLSLRATGDVIYIPTDASEVIPEDITKMIDRVGGTDLVLDAEGNIVFAPGGDLASVVGVDNIAQAITSRIMTEVGDLTLHPEYGTEMQELIGSPNLLSREKLMEVAVLRALSQEDRVSDTTINTLTLEGTSVFIDISYKISVSDTPQNLSLSF
jgi:phage baseplate assembly protein W